MPFADHGGVSLHWQEQGEGTPVLLVMGHRYSSAMWYPMIPALAAEHRVIWFDNRGTGQSDAARKTSVQEMAADALCVMDAAGVARAHIFGVSMGGVLALELAMQAPQRVTSLVLGCTGILTRDKPRLPAFMRAFYYLPPWVLKLLTPSRGGAHGYGSAAPPDAIATDLAVLAKDKFVIHGVVAQAAAIAAYSTTRDEVGALTIPALVIHGDEDSTVRFEWGVELAQTLPNSTFLEVKGAGHNFLVAGGDRVRTAVVEFVEAVDQGASG